MYESMIPIGKAMAEALLESDESTASLSEGSMETDYFEDTQLIPPVTYSNPNTSDFIGKAMAESLLESDECAASLSEGRMAIDYFQDTHLMHSVKYPNSNTRTFMLPNSPHNPLSGLRPLAQREIRRPPIQHLPLSSIHGNHASFSECRYVALDCEMGPGGRRSVLARVSIVDYFGQCLFDKFVKVEERVTDYRHHVTGISPPDLTSGNALPFGVCRQQVISLIRHKVLVGHGLENDLAILGIHHPWFAIRDTSIYYPYQKQDRNGRICPSRLCHLAKIHLGIEIQKHGQPHCPIEDACAAMALYRKNQLHWDNFMDLQHRHTMQNYR